MFSLIKFVRADSFDFLGTSMPVFLGVARPRVSRESASSGAAGALALLMRLRCLLSRKLSVLTSKFY
jgi:hypothetical protein